MKEDSQKAYPDSFKSLEPYLLVNQNLEDIKSPRMFRNRNSLKKENENPCHAMNDQAGTRDYLRDAFAQPALEPSSKRIILKNKISINGAGSIGRFSWHPIL